MRPPERGLGHEKRFLSLLCVFLIALTVSVVILAAAAVFDTANAYAAASAAHSAYFFISAMENDTFVTDIGIVGRYNQYDTFQQIIGDGINPYNFKYPRAAWRWTLTNGDIDGDRVAMALPGTFPKMLLSGMPACI